MSDSTYDDSYVDWERYDREREARADNGNGAVCDQ
jgi:hypothetical protein